jgi:very-short-patch-repair endonuclease
MQLGGFRFRRQHPLGPYVVDFFCSEAKLIVEVDGGQHADESPTRAQWLEARGYRILRFWNNDVLGNTEGVLLEILRALRAPATPHPGTLARSRPPPQGGR